MTNKGKQWEWEEKPKIWKLLVEHDSPNGLLEISEQDQGRLVHLVRQSYQSKHRIRLMNQPSRLGSHKMIDLRRPAKILYGSTS